MPRGRPEKRKDDEFRAATKAWFEQLFAGERAPSVQDVVARTGAKRQSIEAYRAGAKVPGPEFWFQVLRAYPYVPLRYRGTELSGGAFRTQNRSSVAERRERMRAKKASEAQLRLFRALLVKRKLILRVLSQTKESVQFVVEVRIAG